MDSSPVDETAPLFTTSPAWRAAYPGAHAGILALRDAANPAESAQLNSRKEELERSLRSRFAGQDRAALREHPVLKAYEAHYKRFDKTYHVRLQLESIIFKGKPIPGGAALVEAMFMAEVDSMLLTAGHDLDAIRPPLTLDVARGTESYVLLRGTQQAPKAGDMMISDSEGIVSSVIYGPDQRTQITSQTTSAVFTVYATAGIGASDVRRHLEAIQRNVELIAPAARVELLQVHAAN
jgi:DNA/RNA-binding domain of Phe-tRNA-synthetase-like protein